MSGESSTSPPDTAAAGHDRRGLIVLVWLWVGVPLAYGLYELVRKVTQLFTG
ncbi:MFS transporter small subunit [Streptomyces sp. KMM 9044]|uniref:MFS transporter small subunit n=1 Tax=Streptomyces sp. KMM 9044 TaxID=2744474 RepID=UPI0021519B8D|nr:hypothetical protein [Streptomyces sp. KMM 9044]WAX76873.1 hypothetical protein HUV60_003550 [Streptomyces sp. KMM 9044]